MGIWEKGRERGIKREGKESREEGGRGCLFRRKADRDITSNIKMVSLYL